MKMPRILVVAACALLVAGCGSSARPKQESSATSLFHNSVVATISAKSFRFSITTRNGSQPAAQAKGSFFAPDRSQMTVGDTERITAGDAAYFHGGAFGTSGWAKSDKGGTADPDFLAILIAVQNAQPIGVSGTAYTFDVAQTATTPVRHWKVWLASGRVSRVQYRSTSGLTWDEQFTDYDTVPNIEAPPASETHELMETPPCATGTQSNFAGFCRPA
jgi:hypothetical protein